MAATDWPNSATILPADAALAAFDKANKASVGEAKVKGLRAVLGGRQEERAFCCVWIEE